ncbi:MAG: hypothetical protein AAGH92_06810 [Planctomycetota bacterium]
MGRVIAPTSITCRWLFLVLALAWLGVLAEGQPSSLPDDRKRLLMHFMPWYIAPNYRDHWGRHWTGHERQHDPTQIDASGRRDIWSHYDPLIGPYDSADPDVLECQLLQMKLAGIDGVIVDWYGIADAANYPPSHAATQAVFAATGRLGMQFAVCYEDRTVKHLVEIGHLAEAEIEPHLIETFRWMKVNWFDAAHYTKIDGRPLLLNFGPIDKRLREPERWNAARDSIEPRPKLFALHHLWEEAGVDGGFTWFHPDAWANHADSASVRRRLTDIHHETGDPSRVIPSAVPGFRDVYTDPHPVIDHRRGQTLRDSLTAAMAGPWTHVQLATWNDYGEGTMIEPTREFGYTFLEVIQEARGQELGNAFPFAAEDLRLPTRLLMLRRAGTAPENTLDAIAERLMAGDTDTARTQLDTLNSQAERFP